jgi:hypothetical protein
VLHLKGLAAGRYDLYFGVDLTPNGLNVESGPCDVPAAHDP